MRRALIVCSDQQSLEEKLEEGILKYSGVGEEIYTIPSVCYIAFGTEQSNP